MDKGYEFFEHTADVGMRLWAKALPDLFDQAARGLTALLVDNPEQIQPRETRLMTLSASSIDELLPRWLKELLFWFATERFLMAACAFESLSAQVLRGTVRGEPFDLARHQPGTEVKGITYHQFRIEQGPGGWEACVIVDV